MATVPTTPEIQEYIFEYIRAAQRQPRADEIAADVTQLQIHLQQNYGIRAAEYEAAVNGLLASGEFRLGPGSKYLIITDSGFARL